jgi:hypothetical protein
MTTSIDAAFGPDNTKRAITYDEVAEFLKTADKRALNRGDAGDVISLLEFMHDHTITLIEQNQELEARLQEREKAIREREAELAIKQRAVDAVLRIAPAPQKKRYFWR